METTLRAWAREPGEITRELSLLPLKTSALTSELGISRQFLSAVARGQKPCDPGMAARLAIVLGREMDDLFRTTGTVPARDRIHRFAKSALQLTA